MRRSRRVRWEEEAEARVERAVDALQHLILSGRPDGVRRWTAVLWQHRAQALGVVHRRLQARPVRTPGFLLDVLGGLGGEQAPRLLRDVAANPLVPETVRMEARRRAGWPLRERQARAAFLRTLPDPVRAVLGLVAGALGPVPDAQGLEEALGYLLAMPAVERVGVTSHLVGEAAPATAWLLRALLASPDDSTRRDAVEALLDARDRGAVPSLRRCACHGPFRPTAEPMLVAARRLELHAVDAPRASVAREPLVTRALLGPVDGRGGQPVAVLRSWDENAVLVARWIVGDEGGVRSVQGWMRAAPDQAMELCADGSAVRQPLVEASLGQARAAVYWGVEMNLRAGRLPPAAFPLWEPFLHEDLVPTVVPAGPALLAHTAPEPSLDAVTDLLAAPCCRSWQFGPQQIAAALRTVDRRGSGPVQYYTDVVRAVCHPSARSRLAQRLRRQAWVLERAQEERLRDTALGCATQLEAGHAAPLSEQPLLQGMLTRGLAAMRRPKPE